MKTMNIIVIVDRHTHTLQEKRCLENYHYSIGSSGFSKPGGKRELDIRKC